MIVIKINQQHFKFDKILMDFLFLLFAETSSGAGTSEIRSNDCIGTG